MASDKEHSPSRSPSLRRPRSPQEDPFKKNKKHAKKRSRSRSRLADRYRDRYNRESNHRRRSRSCSRDRVQHMYWSERYYGFKFSSRRERYQSRSTPSRENRPTSRYEVASSSRRNRPRPSSPLRINHREG